MNNAVVVVLVLVLLVHWTQALHVVVFGVDGLGGDWLLKAPTPVMQSLMANGTSTMVMQNVLGTSSSQNWFSMVGGAGPDQHGVYHNDWKRGDSIQTPSMFSVLRQHLPHAKIGAFYQWPDFSRLVEDDVFDRKENPGNERQTIDAAIAWLRSDKPDLLFIHVDLVDDAGHKSHWGSNVYLQAIGHADQLLGEVIEALEQENIANDSVVLVCADHGGGQFGFHGRDSAPFRNIPFIISGLGINKNVTVSREVRIFDISATVMKLFNAPLPLSWIATPVYEAFNGFTLPLPLNGLLSVLFVSEYQLVYDTSNEVNLVFRSHSIWRPLAPPGFVSLGDVVVQGYDPPTFSTPVVLDDNALVHPPLAYERIWTNAQFFMKQYRVSLWQPIPHYGDSCFGTFASVDKETSEPQRSLIRCVPSSFTLPAEAKIVAQNVGFSMLEYGFWVSLWESYRSDHVGIASHSFVTQRDLIGPGALWVPKMNPRLFKGLA